MYFYVSDNLKDTIIYTINQLIVNILIHYFHKFKQFLRRFRNILKIKQQNGVVLISRKLRYTILQMTPMKNWLQLVNL